METELLTGAMLVSILAATVRIATPILLAALGELVVERTGILNMGVEGMMLLSALTGFLAVFHSGSLALGLAAAMATGASMALLLGLFTVGLKVEQIVAGMVLNLLASGLSAFGYKLAFKDLSQGDIPTIETFTAIDLPGLSRLPVLGEALFSQEPLTYVALAMVVAVSIFLYRTRWGLELRCIGENPKALDTKGLAVAPRQYAALVFGGVMAGLGGAFLTLGLTGRFVPEISAGRGWLAIVIVIAGAWRPAGVLAAALIFAFLDALQLHVQGSGIRVPYQLLLMLPYVVAILALAVRRARSGAPQMLGVPYTREG